MATIVDLISVPSTPPAVSVVPGASIAPWVTAIGVGGLTEVDALTNGVILEPDPDSYSSRRVLKRVAGAGTTLRLRLVYAKPDPSDMVDPVIRVFGSHTSTGEFVAIRNLRGDLSVVIRRDSGNDTIVVRETTPETARVSLPDNEEHSWDCDGYEYFYVGVERAYAKLNGIGNPQAALLQAKIP